jgi:hypothetical protein
MAIKFALKDQNQKFSDMNAGKAELVVTSPVELVEGEDSGMDGSGGDLFTHKSPAQKRKRKN